MKSILSRLLRYFLQGLLLISPIALTVYIILWVLQGLDSLLTFSTPGLGIVIVVGSITVIGALGSNFLTKAFFDFIDDLLNKIPFVKIIYSSLRDLVDAFLGKKSKFKNPVLLRFNDSNLHKLGFVTQESMEQFGLNKMIAVYVPHSYNFSGDLFIVSSSNITPIETKSADIMKFIISGGISSNDLKEVVEGKTIQTN